MHDAISITDSIKVLENVKQDRWWDNYEFLAYIGQEPVGYLRVASFNDARFKKTCPNWWDYMSKVCGWCIKQDDLYNIWCNAHLYCYTSPAHDKSIHPGACSQYHPNDKTMLADLKALDLENNYSNRRLGYIKSLKDLPIVDWISVEDGKRILTQTTTNWQRNGVGTFLYTYAARYLARNLNLPLYGSILQSDSAKACWNKMMASGIYPITFSKRCCSKRAKCVRQRFKMDYTNKEFE